MVKSTHTFMIKNYLSKTQEMRNEDDKYYVQIYLEQQNYEEKNETQKHIEKLPQKQKERKNSNF